MNNQPSFDLEVFFLSLSIFHLNGLINDGAALFQGSVRPAPFHMSYSDKVIPDPGPARSSAFAVCVPSRRRILT